MHTAFGELQVTIAFSDITGLNKTPALLPKQVNCVVTHRWAVLTMQAERDVDDSLLSEALQIGNLGTFEVRGRGGFSHMDPADHFLSVQEVHGCGLLGASGQQAVDCCAAQRGGLDVLGVGDQQHRQTVHWDWAE